MLVVQALVFAHGLLVRAAIAGKCDAMWLRQVLRARIASTTKHHARSFHARSIGKQKAGDGSIDDLIQEF